MCQVQSVHNVKMNDHSIRESFIVTWIGCIDLLDDVASVSDVGAGDGDSVHLGPRGVGRHLAAASSPPVLGRALELKSVPKQGPVLVGTDHYLLFFGSKGHSF